MLPDTKQVALDTERLKEVDSYQVFECKSDAAGRGLTLLYNIPALSDIA